MGSTSNAHSNVHGNRLLPVVIDEAARDTPNRIVYTVPHLTELGDSFENITAFRFANAVNRAAHWIESKLGRSTSFDAIGYIGPHDLTYPVLVLACIKTGYKALLVSPRNSLEGSMAVVDKTDCHIWVRARKANPLVNQILGSKQMEVLDVPTLEELFATRPVAPYPFTKTWEEAKLDPLAVLHTSGSTGLPKPITMRLGTVAAGDAIQDIPLQEGEQITPSWASTDTVFNPFPWFHAASLMVKLGLNFWLGSRIVTEPTNGVISADTIDRIVSRLPVAALFIPPSTVEEIAKTPKTLKKLGASKYVITGGGSLSPQLGDIVNDVVSVRNVYGSTEGGIWAMIAPTRDDWKTFKFPAQLGVDLREVTPGLSELFFVRKPEYAKWQGLFYTFPDDTEYATKDLFAQHPTDPTRWYCVGRADDVVVLSNGEKVQPVDTEFAIMSHPAVQSALVVGNGRFHPAVLLELREPVPASEQQLEALKDRVYADVVEQANAMAPSHARILRNHMMLTVPGKPFLRTDKGTVKRPAMLKLYADEIKAFYDGLEAAEAKVLSKEMDARSPETIADALSTIASKLLRKQLQGHDDLFAAGFDSLLVFQVLGALRTTAARLGKGDVTLAPAMIYANPTIDKLARAFFRALGLDPQQITGGGGEEEEEGPERSHLEIANDMLAKYIRDLPAVGETVIVTGSTGSLGSYLLNTLLGRQEVKKIYCFNRSADAEDKQRALFKARGLKADGWSAKRVEFLQADLSKPDFGLGQEKYAELRREATKVIHNQWPVNFNWDFSSFEPHIRGVRHLVDFAASSAQDTGIFFISSVGSITHWDSESRGAVPEGPIDDLAVAGEQGYSASKLVAEMVLEQAAKRSGVDASVCRVGQIAGPVGAGDGQGEWNRHEWFPTLVASSKHLRALPETLGALDRIEWIPVDLLADIIVELAGIVPGDNDADAEQTKDGGRKKQQQQQQQQHARDLKVRHAVNPASVSWQALRPVVAKHLPEDTQTVPWPEWVRLLRESGVQGGEEAARENPGLKLLDFYEGLNGDAETTFNLETKATRQGSKTMDTLPPVSGQWVDLWMRQWAF
ncbi:L-aminoadipate-semialdehyde dehydrogenase [Xylariomycetidae sp. FL0641]|nr:L-aminoadipate-semialdehyde dehydrogenase [Xylariomycetidae sp. FL0641]